MEIYQRKIYTAGDEKPQPSAPLDVAKFKIKVDWTEPFPERWRTTLEKNLQVWLLKKVGSVAVHSLKLMDDPHCAEVQITPSTALEVLKKHSPITLRFRDKDGENKEVTAWICPVEARSVTVPQKSMLKEDEAPSTKVFRSSMSVAAASEDSKKVEDVAASNKSPNEFTFTLPLAFSWYMNHAFGKEMKQIEKQHGVSICSEVSVSIKPTDGSSPDSVSKASADFHTLVQGCLDSFSDTVINRNQMDSDIVKEAVRAIQSEETKLMFTMSSSNCQFFGPKKFTDVIRRGLEEARMESRFSDSRPTLNDVKHQNLTMDELTLQPEENIDSLSAPLDVAKFKIKVDWTEPFPERWRTTLEKNLQAWLLKKVGSVAVHSLKLMDDPHCAEVQITPSTALEVLKKHSPISLRFRDKDGKNKEVTAWICPVEARSVTVSQKSMLKEDEAPSTKEIGSMSVAAASEDRNNVEDVAASNRSPNESEATNTDAMTPETPAAFTLPLAFSWYMNHAFGKEMKQIEKQHGVSICSEVSVSIKPTDGSSPDSVSKASADFHTLALECFNSFSEAAINPNQIDSDTVKEAVRAIQSQETKLMFIMSSSDGCFFGPKKYTDAIRRGLEEAGMESRVNDINTSLDMDTKDLPTL